MAFNAASMIVGATAIKNAIAYMSIHTTGAVTSSANESTAARVAVSGSVDASGNVTWTNVAFTGGASNGPAIRVGYWSASSGGTYYGGSLLTGDQQFNSSGGYTVTSITESASSS